VTLWIQYVFSWRSVPELTGRCVQTLKPILDTLLIPNCLLHLSLANSEQLKATGWRLVGVYLSKAVTLQFLDISQNNLDKHAIEYIAAALGTISPSLPTSSTDTLTSIPSTPTVEHNFEPPLASPKPSKHKLVTLRIDDCNLRYPSLELLAQAVWNSPLQPHIVSECCGTSYHDQGLSRRHQSIQHQPSEYATTRFKVNRPLSLVVITCGFGGSTGSNKPDCSSNHPTCSHDIHTVHHLGLAPSQYLNRAV